MRLQRDCALRVGVGAAWCALGGAAALRCEVRVRIECGRTRRATKAINNGDTKDGG